MEKILTNLNMDNYQTICFAITAIAITFCLINNFRNFDNVTMVRQIDTTRVHEGLPTDITLTPQDFRTHPELAQIFGVTDPDNTNLDIALESHEHFERVENQLANINYDNLMTFYDILEAFFQSFN